MSLVLEHVSKNFAGHQAVQDLSLTLDQPAIFGLLGTNGAGKTTTIRMILGIITKDQGKINWNDQPVTRKSVNFGYLPEERGIYPKIKTCDQLAYFAKLKGMDQASATESINHWAKRLKVEEYLNLPAEKLSKGNQQKIQFIAAILHDPDLIILDEPFSGLDPVNTELLKNVIIDLSKKGKYIIMSTHQMSVIEEFCTSVLILNRGKTVLQGNLREIKSHYPANRLIISADEDITKFLNAAKLKIEFNKNLQYTVRIPNETAAHQLLRDLIQQNVTINEFIIQKPTLNDIFIEKVEQ